MTETMQGEWMALLKGEAWKKETLENGMQEMYRHVAITIIIITTIIINNSIYRDIARERARLGGDWAIAGVILTSRMREIARCSSIHSSHQKTKMLCYFKERAWGRS